MLYGNQLDAMDAMMRQSYLGRYYHTAHLVQTGAGVGWDIAALNNRALKIAVSQPWSLDGRNFSDRIWTHKAELLTELRTGLTASLLTGNTCEQTVKTLMKRFGVDRNKAERLVYTENAYIQAVAQGDAYREMGVRKYRFIATLDDRTSDICRSTDGQVFDMAAYQPGETAPPLHPWCRSATCPYYDKLAEVGERAARNPETRKTYFVPRSMTYADWEKTFVKGGSKAEKSAVGAVELTGPVALKMARKSVLDGEWPLKIHRGRQEKHIQGTNNYQEGKSYLTISVEEAQELVDKHHGTGEFQTTRKGDWNQREVVEVEQEIGVDVDEETKKETPTKRVTIHYSKKGIHIVPAPIKE